MQFVICFNKIKNLFLTQIHTKIKKKAHGQIKIGLVDAEISAYDIQEPCILCQSSWNAFYHVFNADCHQEEAKLLKCIYLL